MVRWRDWYEQAARDLEMARTASERGFSEWACFCAQQAAEKALKAVFHARGELAWGHSVRELLLTLSPEPAAALLDAARELDRCYIPARYPDGFERGAPKDYFGEADASRNIGGAAAILRYCASLLP